MPPLSPLGHLSQGQERHERHSDRYRRPNRQDRTEGDEEGGDQHPGADVPERLHDGKNCDRSRLNMPGSSPRHWHRGVWKSWSLRRWP